MEYFSKAATESVRLDEASSAYTFLPHWDDSRWNKLLEYIQPQMFSPGSTILRAGLRERALYIVAFGQVAMFVNTKRRFPFRLGKRETAPLIVGVNTSTVMNILTFLDGEPGIATYKATSECQLLYLSIDTFDVFSVRYPKLGRELLFDLGRLLAQQVRRTSSVLTFYKG
ncbi:MAG: cyclic nucleotide-binding domain-containing protein [Chloroflexota bacterium]